MISFMTVEKAQVTLAGHMKAARLTKNLTQEGLSNRSGVSLATVRKFEQKGVISLESFLKLCMALGCLEKVVGCLEPKEVEFSSLDDVLKETPSTTRSRGRKT